MTSFTWKKDHRDFTILPTTYTDQNLRNYSKLDYGIDDKVEIIELLPWSPSCICLFLKNKKDIENFALFFLFTAAWTKYLYRHLI
jgi:hypothetical protein